MNKNYQTHTNTPIQAFTYTNKHKSQQHKILFYYFISFYCRLFKAFQHSIQKVNKEYYVHELRRNILTKFLEVDLLIKAKQYCQFIYKKNIKRKKDRFE